MRKNIINKIFIILFFTLIGSVSGQQRKIIKPDLSSNYKLTQWEFEGSGLWKISDDKLILYKAGIPSGLIRKPSSLAILKSKPFKKIKIETEIKSTAPLDIVRRDLDIILAYKSPSSFYYIHLSGVNDDVHNGIFIVNNSDRRRIDSGRGKPQLKDNKWHKVRAEWDGEKGQINVYVDNSGTPVLEAKDNTIKTGRAGVGSFDDTGEFKNILITGFTNGSMTNQESFQLDNKRALFLGNSITQIGMYVSYIEYYLQNIFPKKSFDIISIGLSSETVSGLTETGSALHRPVLFERLDRALEKIKPDVVIACYGMNDGIYHPQNPKRFKSFQDGVIELINKAKSINAQIIFITPPVFDPLPITKKTQQENADEYGFSKPYYKYDDVLSDYSNYIVNLNIEGVKTINLHSAMKKYILENRNKESGFIFSPDGVHPSDAGHLFMAQEFLKGMDIPIKQENLDAELQQIRSDSLFTLIDESRKIRSKGWLEYVGYTKGETIKTNEIESTEKKVEELKKKIEMLKKKTLITK